MLNIEVLLIVVPANEAGVSKNFIFFLFLTPKIGEGVNDDSENQVKNDNDNDEEEQQIVDDPREEPGRNLFVKTNKKECEF